MDSIKRLYGQFYNHNIFVIGAGTSLIDFDFTRLDGRITIAINDVVRHMEPTYHFVNDGPKGLQYVNYDYGPTIPIMPYKPWNPIEHVGVGYGFVTTPHLEESTNRNDDTLFCNFTTATAAIQFCWKMRAKRVFLLGIDGYRYRGRRYFYETGDYVPEKVFDPYVFTEKSGQAHTYRQRSDMVRDMRKLSETIARNEMSVSNCNPDTEFDAFPVVDIDRVAPCGGLSSGWRQALLSP